MEPLASAARKVASEVTKSVENMLPAENTGDVIIGTLNMRLLNADKANYFQDSYNQIVPRHHLLFLQEVDASGLSRIARDNGYDFRISPEGQDVGLSVGFLVSPRLKILPNTHSYEDVARVILHKSNPALRPALRLDLQDRTTGNKFSAVVVHLKSSLGGEERTNPVRDEQVRLLANDLGKDFSGIVGSPGTRIWRERTTWTR